MHQTRTRWRNLSIDFFLLKLQSHFLLNFCWDSIQWIQFFFSIYFSIKFTASSSTTISSGLKAQTWSPWSPHHHALFHRPSKANHNNWTTPIQPIRRASMMSSRNDDESYVFHSAKKHFTKINTFNGSLSLSDKSNSMENVSIKSNPF